MPAIKRLAGFAIATALTAQPNLIVQGLEAYNKGDYVTAERDFRAANAPSMLALVEASTGRCAGAESSLAKPENDPTLARLMGLALARCQIAAAHLDDA